MEADAIRPAADTGGDRLFDPAMRADPYPVYAAIRDSGPAFRLPNGSLAFTRHADVAALLRDHRLGKDAENRVAPRRPDLPSPDEPALAGLRRSMLMLDPPDHTRLRGLVVRAFTAKRMDELRPRIEALVDRLIDDVEPRGQMDVIGEFAHRLPVIVICDLLGVPEEERHRFLGDFRVGGRVIDPTPMSARELTDANAHALKMRAFWEEMFERRAAEPGDDLITALMAVEDAHDGRLSRDEMASNIGLLFGAGHETTTNLIGNGLIAMQRSGEWDRLVADPSLAANAAEECLRYDSPVQLTGRRVMEDAEAGSVALPRGEHVVCLLGAANRDPAVYDDPDRVDIGRKGIKLLSFGGGIHFCLGAQLARTEGEIAFRRLAERLPAMRLELDNLQWRSTITLRGVTRLAARW